LLFTLNNSSANVHPSRRNSPSRGPQRIGPLFNSLRKTKKDGTASTATGDQIAPKGYQREAHLDG
jgi:hypothetical protein